MATQVSTSDFDVNEAAANAKKLALSTNSTPSWSNPFAFDYYSQIPPPTVYGGGLNFMTGSGTTFAPPPIPQLSSPSSLIAPRPMSSFSRHPLLPPRQSQPYTQPPPPAYIDFSQPPPNFLKALPPPGTWNGNTAQNGSSGGDDIGVARNPENGPKPIRFSLNPAGRKHVFNKPITAVRQTQGVRPAGPTKQSRFSPQVMHPLNGTTARPDMVVTNSVPSQQQSKESYGLSSGSSWASDVTTTTPAQSVGIGNQSVGNNLIQVSVRSRLQSADFATCINSDNWPFSLKKYAEKWFTVILTSNPNDMDRAQDLLREKIEEAYVAGDFKTRDWMLEPLPLFPSTNGLKGIGSTPIPGTVKGTPFKLDSFPAVIGRGGGRGRGRGSISGRVEAFKKQQGRPKGIRGRNRFRSRSTSRSWSRSRSRSRSSSGSPDTTMRSKKRKRSNSGSKNKKNEKKKEKGKNKKQKGKNKAHIYSEFGSVGGQVTEASNARLDARAARFAKDEAKSKVSMKSRLGGFVNNSNLTPVKWGLDKSPGGTGLRATPAWDMNSRMVGSCTDLEKMYLRLTTAPDPSTIRPVHVLRRALGMVCEKWKKTEDYRYACDQLKSIRQDLTVQRVREPFTILVYETHARIALERGDHEEFNQCQSQLVQLYSTVPNGKENQKEFTAYRILYYIFTTSTLDLGTVLAKLSDDERRDECISHALKVRSAWAIGNYCEFFRLHKIAPRMSAYLIDWFVNRERKNALRKILKAYRPTVPTTFVQTQLDLTEEGWTSFLKVSQLESTLIYVDVPTKAKINARDSHAALIAALGAG